MYCIKCGKEIPENVTICPFCRASQLYSRVDEVGSALLPKNSMALISYYLGIVALLCGLAGIPALITGILGLKFAKNNPDAKGQIHAWVGIILGTLAFICQLLLAIAVTVAIFQQ